jgi:hypothetical protein
MLRPAFHLALRQTEGLMTSGLTLMGLTEWRKLHLAVDAARCMILPQTLTDQEVTSVPGRLAARSN